MKKIIIISILMLLCFSSIAIANVTESDYWTLEYKEMEEEPVIPPEEPQYKYDTQGTTWYNATFGATVTVQSNEEPTITNEVPLNESIGISLQPICNVTVTDGNGNAMNVTFTTNESGLWVQKQSNTSVVNGSYQWYFSDADTHGTKYWWKVYCDDGTNNVSKTFHFTTQKNDSVIITNPYPANESTGISINLYEWNVTINEPEGHAFFWNITAIDSSTGNWVGTNESSADTNGSKLINVSGNLSYNKLYYVYVNASDFNTWTNKSFEFTTEQQVSFTWYNVSFGASVVVQAPNSAPIFSNPNPANNSIDQSLAFTWNITIEDPNGDTFNWTINCSSGQNSSGNDTSNGSKTLSVSGLSQNTEYKVWVNATDGNDTTNEWFNFTTQDANITWHSATFGATVIVQSSEPIINSVSPSNNSVNQDMYVMLIVNVSEPQSETFNITWLTNTTGTWEILQYNSTCTDGTFSYRALFANESNTKYYWNVSINDTSNNWANATYSFTTATYSWTNWSDWWEITYTCCVGDNFSASAYNKTSINISWDNCEGQGCDSNVLVRNETGWGSATYPTSPTNGTIIYNGTLHNFNDTDLKSATNYYYTLWGWNDTNNEFSAINQTTYATTNGDIEIFTSSVYPANESTEVERPATNISIIINGTNLNVTFYFTNYTDTSNLTESFVTWTSESTQRFEFTGFGWTPKTDWMWGNTKYYWTVNVTDGSVWVNESFNFMSVALAGTKNARYDVQLPLGVLSSADAIKTWNSVPETYNRIYDVQVPHGVLSSADAQFIWNQISS